MKTGTFQRQAANLGCALALVVLALATIAVLVSGCGGGGAAPDPGPTLNGYALILERNEAEPNDAAPDPLLPPIGFEQAEVVYGTLSDTDTADRFVVTPTASGTLVVWCYTEGAAVPGVTLTIDQNGATDGQDVTDRLATAGIAVAAGEPVEIRLDSHVGAGISYRIEVYSS